MEYAGKKVESVRNLYRTSHAIRYAGGEYPPKKLHRIISGILTTSSDWNPPFSEAFKNCLSKSSDKQQIDFGCVLSQGAFYYNFNNKTLKICDKDDSLVYFFLQLLIVLQEIGTVPAIELNAYMQALSILEDKIS